MNGFQTVFPIHSFICGCLSASDHWPPRLHLFLRSWYFTAGPSNSSPLVKSQHPSHPFFFLCVTPQCCFAGTTEGYSTETLNEVTELLLEDVNSFAYIRVFFIHFQWAQNKLFFFLMSKGNDFCFLFFRQLPNISEQKNTALPQQMKTGARKTVTHSKEEQKNVIHKTQSKVFLCVCVPHLNSS